MPKSKTKKNKLPKPFVCDKHRKAKPKKVDLRGFDWERDFVDDFSHKSGHFTRDLDSVTVYYSGVPVGYREGDTYQDEGSLTISGITDEQAERVVKALNDALEKTLNG